jgi:hypothetical protein
LLIVVLFFPENLQHERREKMGKRRSRKDRKKGKRVPVSQSGACARAPRRGGIRDEIKFDIPSDYGDGWIFSQPEDIVWMAEAAANKCVPAVILDRYLLHGREMVEPLSEEVRERVQAHLLGCEECRADAECLLAVLEEMNDGYKQ